MKTVLKETLPVIIAVTIISVMLSGCMDRRDDDTGDTAAGSVMPWAEQTMPGESEGNESRIEAETETAAAETETVTGAAELETGAAEVETEPLERDDTTLRDEDVNEFEKAGIKVISENRFTLNGREYHVDVYYGTYSGCAVFFEQGMTQALSKISVAGVTFRNNCGFAIYACRDGKIYTIKEAYAAGYLTEEDILAIAEMHGNYDRDVEY